MLLQGRKEIELEGDAGMAGGHDAVIDELARVGRTEMAVEADAGARLGVVERDHAARHVGGMTRADGIMAGEPTRGGAMAGLAAAAVRGLEAGTPRSARRGPRMAAGAPRAARRLASAEERRDGKEGGRWGKT